jgi:hypothetical protein
MTGEASCPLPFKGRGGVGMGLVSTAPTAKAGGDPPAGLCLFIHLSPARYFLTKSALEKLYVKFM